MFDLGTVVPLSVTVKNASGNPANAGTMVLTVTAPDATVTTVDPVTPTSTGVYDYDYPTTQAGRHAVRWLATGTNAGAYTSAFVVRPVDSAALVSLADAKAHLGEQSSLQDEEIRTYLDVATEIVEDIAGPCSVRTFTDRVEFGSTQLLLSQRPVVSVTSVTSVRTPSVTWATAALDVNAVDGTVSLLSGGSFTSGPWTVVYRAGRPVPAARHVQAVLEQLWHMWAVQRGQQADSTTPDLLDVAEFETRAAFGPPRFFLAPQVRELLEPDRPPGYP